MTAQAGSLTLEELEGHVRAGTIDTVVVGFTDPYGRLVGKRYDAGFFLEEAAEHGAHACDYLFTVDMEMEPVAGYRFANWERGYGDVHLVPDLASLRRADWLERSALVLCDVEERSGARLDLAPRSVLRRQVEAAAGAGFRVMAASELEFFLFRTSYAEAARRGYTGLEPAGWYIEDYHLQQGAREEDYVGALRRHLARSGVPVENSKGEWGLGQHELNVRYAEVLEMADRHVVYKQCARELADRLGVAVTFMAKPHADRAGSSCHVHLSLWSGDENAFVGDTDCGGGVRGSDAFRWFLGGWIAHAPEVMPLYAPTVNAYKRYRSKSWAPTRLAWSHDNRTAGFRVVGSGGGLRIECRVPGADCNPYLAFAASLASGLDGIARRIEPPAAFEGDVYESADLPEVPRTFGEALATYAASDFARGFLGAEVHEHYRHFFQTELEAFEDSVTDWERARYFERI